MRLILLLLMNVTLKTLANNDDINYAKQLIEWIEAKGGFFNKKLTFYPSKNIVSLSSLGIYVSEDIPEGEELLKIPSKCTIESLKQPTKESFELCNLAHSLHKERGLSEKSIYFPYVSYLYNTLSFSKERIPSAWSKEGTNLIQEIIGEELRPRNISKNTVEIACKDLNESEMEDLSYYISLAQNSNGRLIPFQDMMLDIHNKNSNVNSNSIFDHKDIVIVSASRLQKGERLTISIDDCDDNRDTPKHVLAQVLRDYTFDEDSYPQHWTLFENIPLFLNSFNIYWNEIEKDPQPLSFVVTKNEEKSNKIEITWLGEKPDMVHTHFLHGHLKRLKDFKQQVMSKVKNLASFEKSVIMTLYSSLVKVLDEAAHWEEYSSDLQECTTKASLCHYDKFGVDDDTYTQDMVADSCSNSTMKFRIVDRVSTFHQEMEFFGGANQSNICLALDGYPHICTNMRPTYHEMFVHYPAAFLDSVQRVLFFGGGDSMLLHEILKYPSLELVVGLELDQQVVRSSFKNFRTQPHFDNEKVQWWFADATKSLALLPEDYLESFDLVIVDLLSDVIEGLKLPNGMTVMDRAMQFLAPNGIIVRNVDIWFDINVDVTDYTIDIEYTNVPIFCYQRITIGSNSKNFLTVDPKDHGIETHFYDPNVLLNKHTKFKNFFNFRKRNVKKIKADSEKCCKEDKEKVDFMQKSANGVLLVLEIEEAQITDAIEAENLIKSCLQKLYLSQIETRRSKSDRVILFMLEQGYILSRAWPEHRYFAIDILLWEEFDKMEELKKEMAIVLGSKTSSSFRIVTQGMFGLKSSEKILCPCDDDNKDVTETNSDAIVLSRDYEIEEKLLADHLKLVKKNSLVLMLCDENDANYSCKALYNKLDSVSQGNVRQLSNCPSLVNIDDNEEISEEMICSCLKHNLEKLQQMVKIEKKKVGGVILAPNTRKSMGQTIHKLFNATETKRELLSDAYVILTPLASDSYTDPWQKVFLDRFRNQIAIYRPAFTVDVMFKDMESQGSSTLGIFSFGDESFYSSLVEVATEIETKRGYTFEINNILSGISNYITDNDPKFFTFDDYDQESYNTQLTSQNMLAWQNILRFNVYDEEFFYRISTKIIKKALQHLFTWFERDDMKDVGIVDYQYEGIADGGVVVAVWSMGTAVLLWNGREEIDLNICTYYEPNLSRKIQDEFHDDFLEILFILESKASDEFPRGTGSIVW